MADRSKQAKIFVVDDDQAMCESMRWLIESVGMEVHTYNSAQKFLNEFDRTVPGCLLLDVRMPGMGGLELQKQLNDQGSKMPIIFVTGHGDVPMAVRAMKSGATEFLNKPFNDQILLDAINKAVASDVKRRSEESEREEVMENMAKLTARELDVLRLIVQGKPTKVIAADLELSVKTVDLHRAHILQKMEVRTISGVMYLVYAHDIPL